MAKSKSVELAVEPAPDFLSHLQQSFGWSEEGALEALGAYVVSTKAGRALRNELHLARAASRAA